MANPFENADGSYYVLVNAEGQHSLWPAFVEVPAGWDAVHGGAPREACVAYINEHWTDLRPRSLVEATAEN